MRTGDNKKNMMTDPYAVLGVSRNATQDEIKSAYRKKAKLYHPDLHPNDPVAAQKFKELSEAYQLIISGKADSYSSNQNPYGQNPYGQNPYGQNPYGQQGQYGWGPLDLGITGIISTISKTVSRMTISISNSQVCAGVLSEY